MNIKHNWLDVVLNCSRAHTNNYLLRDYNVLFFFYAKNANARMKQSKCFKEMRFVDLRAKDAVDFLKCTIPKFIKKKFIIF